MALNADDFSAELARQRIATLALSMYQIHGLPAPSTDELGSVVSRAEAAMSLHQLRHPESISAAAFGEINQIVLGAAEAKKRPVNIHGADAPVGGKDGSDKSLTKGADLLDRVRQLSSSTRYRDLPAGEGTGGSYASDRGISGVPAEFARAFAGAGVGRDTIKTFAAVGLDRGTFDQFRHEGFSTAQIADNAKDMKVLGGHGRGDLSIGQHAPTDLRKAYVRDEREHTPESHRNKERMNQRYEALPDSDPRKSGAIRFIKRFDKAELEAEQKATVGVRAASEDGALGKPAKADRPAVAAAQDQNMAAGRRQVAGAVDNDAAKAFDLDAAPPVPKPTLAKVAEAKRPSGPKPS